MRAVRFDHYGGIDVLEVRDVERPIPAPGEALVHVRAAGINPGEARIREGLLHDRFPATFPSGEGSDLAGVIAELGPEVGGWAVGDEVIGFSNRRSSHAELVAVPADQLTRRPPEVPWEVAGALFVAGATAWAAARAVAPQPAETVAISAAAGGVGAIAVQLARRSGATVIGLAGPANRAWLEGKGAIWVDYGGDGLAERLRAAAPNGRLDAFIDTFGGGYVELALELGVEPQRIDTIADFAAIERHGVKGEGSAAGSSAAVLAELASLLAAGELEIPIAATYPLERVRDAYAELERRHTR
ncbi:MAG TPA: NADP-dependent oxidoreductase, partial [Solirubrobacteraceae bacterium]|nr:NADP-dependent oxidoreductase [Solirubrobacteraceae bacterium]